jgi:HEPN domain-containing protein
LKALLQEHGVAFAKTHDLEELLGHATPVDPSLAILTPHLDVLNKVVSVKMRTYDFSNLRFW